MIVRPLQAQTESAETTIASAMAPRSYDENNTDTVSTVSTSITANEGQNNDSQQRIFLDPTMRLMDASLRLPLAVISAINGAFETAL